MLTNNPIYRNSLSLLLALALLLVVPVNANDNDGNAEEWTAVGSTGVADESSLGLITMYQGVAALNYQAYGTAVLRYNVTATDDLFGGNNTRLVMRYLDNGSCSKVEACLFRYSLNTGQIDLLMTIDSNAFPASNAFQTRFVDSASLPAFDFNNNAYYVEVYLSRNCGGDARIGLLRLSRF